MESREGTILHSIWYLTNVHTTYSLASVLAEEKDTYLQPVLITHSLVVFPLTLIASAISHGEYALCRAPHQSHYTHRVHIGMTFRVEFVTVTCSLLCIILGGVWFTRIITYIIHILTPKHPLIRLQYFTTSPYETLAILLLILIFSWVQCWS